MRLTRDNAGYKTTPRNQVKFGDVFSLLSTGSLGTAQYVALGQADGETVCELFSVRLSDRHISFSHPTNGDNVGVIGQVTGVKFNLRDEEVTMLAGGAVPGSVLYADGYTTSDGKAEALLVVGFRDMPDSYSRKALCVSLAQPGKIVTVPTSRRAHVIGNASFEIVAV